MLWNQLFYHVMDNKMSSVKYFNYPSNNLPPAKSLAQEMLDAEGAEIESENIYDESSKLLGDDNLDQ